MKISLLKEPFVEFADNFLCDDPKKGIALTGFYSLSNNTHRSEIHYAVVGTNKNIEDFVSWIDNFSHPIEASAKQVKFRDELEIEEDGSIYEGGLFSDDDFDFFEEESAPTQIINKKLNPDFPGFSKDSVFQCEFLLDKTNGTNSIKKSDIDKILKEKKSNKEKIEEIIEIYVDAYKDILEYSQKIPDICYLVIPSEIYNKLASVKNGNYYLNFRRKLKAAIFSCARNIIPVQIVLEDTITGKKKSMQDLSMIAWNFVVAQYYKTESCIPWSLTDIDSDTCFIGISFHKILDAENKFMRSSIAQAFNRDGKGLIFTGNQFEWNSSKTKVSTPHLKYDYAKELIFKVLKNYIRINGHTPKRVVIHKTSDFWDSYKHKDYAEVEGFTEGIKEALNIDVDIDFVTLKPSKQKLFRSRGEYPVMRGTLLELDEFTGVLYTTGYIPYYESYPGVHIPMGIHVEIIGESTLKKICEEIMALTKLNFNNCNYYSSLPITLNFSHRVGEILQYLPEGIEPPNRYFFYM